MSNDSQLEADLREYYDAEYKDVFFMPDFDKVDAVTKEEIRNSFGFSRWRFRRSWKELVVAVKNLVKK